MILLGTCRGVGVLQCLEYYAWLLWEERMWADGATLRRGFPQKRNLVPGGLLAPSYSFLRCLSMLFIENGQFISGTGNLFLL